MGIPEPEWVAHIFLCLGHEFEPPQYEWRAVAKEQRGEQTADEAGSAR